MAAVPGKTFNASASASGNPLLCHCPLMSQPQCRQCHVHLQLADTKQGVIGVDFKQVSCDKLGPVDSADSSNDSPRNEDDKSSKDSPRDDNDGNSQQDHGDDKGKDDSSSTSDWIDKKKAEFKKKRDEMSGKDVFLSKWERPSWVK